jgi:hypothetical protein
MSCFDRCEVEVLLDGQEKPVAALINSTVDKPQLLQIEQSWNPWLNWIGTDDSHWPWSDLASPATGDPFCPKKIITVSVANHLQGIMRIDLTGAGRMRHPNGKELVYVDRIAVAPWNRRQQFLQIRRYKPIGWLLIRHAIINSFLVGFSGRIGLHALRSSESWYRSLGMTEYEDDPEHEGLRYFEFDEKGAKMQLHDSLYRDIQLEIQRMASAANE